MFSAINHSLVKSILSSKKRPRIAGVSSGLQTASNAVSCDYPNQRGAGRLCICFITATKAAGSGGNIALPSGFTAMRSLSSTGGVGFRIAYRFLDGTEGTTVSSTTTGNQDAIIMVLLTFDDCYSSRIPDDVAVVSGTSTAPDSASLTATAPFTDGMLWISFVGHDSTTNITGWPIGFGGRMEFKSTAGVGATLGLAYEYFQQTTIDPSAFTLNASASWNAVTIGVRAL